jgi:XTP/dITP diphosphohydrolase
MEPLRVVLASGNKGKLREINQLLEGLHIEAVPQTQLGVTDVAETGLSFVENALIKARHASQLTGLPAIADDSGLEVDALHGAPGIYSARFAGENAADADNVRLLLEKLGDLPKEQRGARFQCLMVFLRHAKDPTPLICQGTWEGHILTESVGDNGFGYDPVFFVPGEGCSAAQLAADVKNRLSHRGQALRALVAALKSHPPTSHASS